jgi:hypothetical protein
MVGDGDQPDARAGRLDDDTTARLRLGPPGTGERDPRRREQVEGVLERRRLEVEGMVVGDADRRDADRPQSLDRPRGPAEEERLSGNPLRRVPAGGDAAFEIADDEVEGAAEVAQLRRPEVLGIASFELRGDAAAQHHVAEEADAHGV